MSSSEILKIAKRVIKEEPEIFEALLEFERTKKMPKIDYKVRATFTVDANLFREFRKEAEKRHVNMSGVVEEAIIEKVKEWRNSKNGGKRFNN